MKQLRTLSVSGLAVLLTVSTLVAQEPDWAVELSYKSEELFSIRRGYLGMPFVEVTIADSGYAFLFDTGDMVGFNMATPLLDRLQLPEVGRWNSYDSGGKVIGSFRSVRAPLVRVFGHSLVDQTIFEFDNIVLGGLVGPDALPGTRFTLDYRAERIAVTTSSLKNVPSRYVALQITRSRRHPLLILAMGTVNGWPVLIEFDTGASRTNIDPGLVQRLQLPRDTRGARIDSLMIGPLHFMVPSARVNPKTGIDSELDPLIELAVGSDILRHLLLTVDYQSGQMLLRDNRIP